MIILGFFQLVDCFQKLIICLIVLVAHLSRNKSILQQAMKNYKFNPQRSMKKITKKPNTQQQKIAIGMSDQNFKIYLRVKPSIPNQPNHQILKILNSNKVQITSPYYTINQIEKIYTYEQVFDETFNNAQVFGQTMIQPISNALQGFNSTVFIYGMTGSGKTYTMFGSIGNGTSTGLRNEEEGLVSMTIDYMFNQIQKQSQIKSQIAVSFYEIYNQNIKDLLQEQQQSLTIMQDPIRGVFINGLAEVMAEDKNQIKDVIISGIQRRAMNATRSNEVSSRSHAILQFVVKRYLNSTQKEASVLESKFFMIDLAGNQKTSHNQSRRFIEGVNINKSLLTLGKCLSILAQKKAAYVPFRDSKLTRILKQSLGGNSKTVMIACISSQKRFYQQTLNTLKYSSIAKKIKNKGVKNNIKMIAKEQIPDNRNFVNGRDLTLPATGPVLNKIKKILGVFLNSVEVKFRIEKLQQDLEASRKQNEDLLNTEEADSQICKNNIKKINETLQQLLRPYEKHLQKVQLAYQQLMASVNEILGQKRKEKENINPNLQVLQLKQIIADQNRKIQYYEQRFANSTSIIHHLESQNFDFENIPNQSLDCKQTLTLNTFNSPKIQKQNSVPSLNSLNTSSINRPSQRSQSKSKKLTLNLLESDETFRSSTINHLNSSNRSQCSLLQKKGINNRLQKEIVINLNGEKMERRSQQSSKDQFVKRLKQTQKKVKGVQSEEITSILKEQQIQRYELGNVQMSMIRKLKFFQKEKSLQKSHSLSKTLNRNQESIKLLMKKV